MIVSDPQPELRWAPIPPAPRHRGRMWLIIGLIVAAVVIVGLVLFFVLPRGTAPEPGTSSTPTPSPSSSTTPTPTPTPTSTETSAPVVTPPPVVDPTIEAFRGQVSGWLNDALRGLDIVAGASGQDALPVVDSLQQDAQRLSDAQAPASIAEAWRDDLEIYSQRLSDLRSAVSAGSGVSGAVDAARAAAQDLRTLVGL
ncbi:hypothetical protein [Microbacterium sp. LWO12-1.2]|uniref:hypothetical protein n=1 Tax=Microbacterium sp. LWO12-1.2 TaxID=3135261 RepID=UPI0034323E3A